MSRPRTVYLSLGSNVGDRLSHIKHALELLSTTPGISVRRVAGLYETEPVGVHDQPWFLNTVAEIATDLDPRALLAAVKRVESVVGRTPSYRWGPREIDVDILIYEGEKISQDDLVIPHPRMRERLFVLMPLRELAPDWRDEDGHTIDRLIEGIKGTAEVRPYPER